MDARRLGLVGLLLAALVAGTIADVPNPRVSREIGGYHVLAADFHVHVFPFGWSALPPWDTVIEARHQGLDVVAITPHNGHLWLARVGRWFARVTGGPIVIVGEEIGSSRYHMLAVGIVDAVSSELSAADAIDEVHRQGGVAIAAHPYEQFQPAYDAEALQKLDGSEVVRPETQHDAQAAAQLREFFARAETTAIGASDYHSAGTRVGHSRTYVFALDRTEQAVLDAIREGRTVVYDRERAYGDPALIELAAASGGLPNVVPELPAPGALRVFSKVAAALALVVVLLLNRWSKPR